MTERVWKLEEAGNKLDELVSGATRGETQVIAKHGKRVAVLISADRYASLADRNTSNTKLDFVQHLLSAPKGDFLSRRRNIPVEQKRRRKK